MKRLAIILVLLAAGAFVVLSMGAGGSSDTPEYRVELDNAFGLTEGGDLKIAGVRAGKITKLGLNRRTKRAVVGFRIDETGFGSLRSDVRCAVLPQSLVGEYFLDCQPGKKQAAWPRDRTIPVTRTTTVVPPDLVNNIQRRPYRERLRLIIAELGAAVGANGENLNAALRRANPALRETNKVLAILARQNQVLADLAKNGDEVLAELAENRNDVSRFVVEARDAARASAERDDEIAAGFRRLPTFLRELRPTMRELGRTADEQGPALRNLSASAGQLERLFENLPPFAEASRVGLNSLGEASKVGRGAVKTATPTVEQLSKYASKVPDVGGNLAIILEHLNDRDFAAEPDPASPGGKGYTGLEAFFAAYVFDQTLAINIFDRDRHLLKATPFEGHCAPYADIEAARDKATFRECGRELGPNAIGINFPDETAPRGFDGKDRGPEQEDTANGRAARARSAASGDRARARRGGDRGPVRMPTLDRVLPGSPDPPRAPGVEKPLNDRLPDVQSPARDDAARGLVDYLLGG
jgi:ABC-type transporter Mla subunit MlaD